MRSNPVAGLHRFLGRHRYDVFALLFVTLIVLWYFFPLLARADIVFADPEIPSDTRRYLGDIGGLWNSKLNIDIVERTPKILFALFPWLSSALFGFSGVAMVTTMVLLVVGVGAVSAYVLTRHIFLRYSAKDLTFYQAIALASGALLYVLNPWFVQRIDQPYRLWGYSLIPLVLLLLLRLFDPGVVSGRPRRFPFMAAGEFRRSVVDATGLALTLSATAASMEYFIAGVFFAGVLPVLLLAGRLFRRRRALVADQGRFAIAGAFAVKAALVALLFTMFSYFWLAPYLGEALSGRVASGAAEKVDLLTSRSRRTGAPLVLLLFARPQRTIGAAAPDGGFYVGGAALLLIIAFGVTLHLRKAPVLVLIAVVGAAVFVAGLGTSLRSFAPGHVALTKNVRLFRRLFSEPDLMLGLLALAYSVFLACGMYSLLKSGPSVPATLSRSIVFSAVLVALLFYNRPLRRAYVEEVSSAAEAPGEPRGTASPAVSDVEESRRVVYLPRASGPVNRRGNVGYYLNHVQYLLDNGLTDALPLLLSSLQVDTLAYVGGFPGSEGRQAFDLAMLQIQRNMRIMTRNGRVTTYDLHSATGEAYAVPVAIHSPAGLSTRSALGTLTGADGTSVSYLYSHMAPGNTIREVRSGDLIEGYSFDELWLSNLDERFYVPAAEGVVGGDPYVGWARSSVDDPGWTAYLDAIGIDRFPFDFDLGVGLAVTFAPSRLAVAPYAQDDLRGTTVMNLDAMQRLGLFFGANDRERYTVECTPRPDFANFDKVVSSPFVAPAGRAVRVGESGMIEIAPSTPLRLRLDASGEEASQMQLRLRFYDETRAELGACYLFGPEAEARRDRVRFFADFLSPPTAKFLRIELRAPRIPENGVRWRVHGLEILDLGAYRAENTFALNYRTENAGTYALYARVFVSPRGGVLEVSALGTRFKLDTRTVSRTGFVWMKLDSVFFPEGVAEIGVRNIEGFNAVNVFAVIPESEAAESRFPIRRALQKGRIYFSLEAEQAFEYSGNVQTSRRYPELSLGRGIASDDGVLTRDIDILKSGSYRVILRASGHKNRSSITTTLTNLDSGEVISRKVSINATLPSIPSRAMVETARIDSSDYPLAVARHDGALPDLQFLMLDAVDLRAGRYRIQIRLNSSVSNLASIYGLRKFDPASVRMPVFRADTPDLPCTSCGAIDQSMMRHSFSGGKITMSFDPGCSCEWYVYSTGRIGVAAADEYLIRFDARSELLQGRHTKVLFLDESNRVVATELLAGPPESSFETWSHYEHIVRVPKNANQMLFQIWGRADRTRRAIFEMRNLSVLPYKELPMLDVVYFIESDAVPILAGAIGSATMLEVARSRDNLKRTVDVRPSHDPRTLVGLDVTANPLWSVEREEGEGTLSIALDGVGAGVFTVGDRVELRLRYRSHFYAGIVLFVLAFPLAYVLLAVVSGSGRPFPPRRRRLRSR